MTCILVTGANGFVGAQVVRTFLHSGFERLSLPETAVWRVSRLLGREEIVTRLFGSLVVDCEKTRLILGWEPPLTLDEGPAETVCWYLQARGKAAALGNR